MNVIFYVLYYIIFFITYSRMYIILCILVYIHVRVGYFTPGLRYGPPNVALFRLFYLFFIYSSSVG